MREHRVPLCGRALEVLDAARTLGDGDGLVFPMRSGRPISASTLPKMLQYHRIAAVAHGFRSSFRDWAAEETDHPREVIEAALAHVVQNKVEARLRPVGPVRASAAAHSAAESVTGGGRVRALRPMPDMLGPRRRILVSQPFRVQRGRRVAPPRRRARRAQIPVRAGLKIRTCPPGARRTACCPRRCSSSRSVMGAWFARRGCRDPRAAPQSARHAPPAPAGLGGRRGRRRAGDPHWPDLRVHRGGWSRYPVEVGQLRCQPTQNAPPAPPEIFR